MEKGGAQGLRRRTLKYQITKGRRLSIGTA
jgi:hypothetical protein